MTLCKIESIITQSLEIEQYSSLEFSMTAEESIEFKFPLESIFLFVVSLKAQLIRFSDSCNLDLELLVPLITIVILLFSRKVDAAIAQPLFFVKPVFKPSLPFTLFNNLFLLGCFILLYSNSFSWK